MEPIKFKSIRKRLKKTQTSMAEVLNISKSSIQKYESGDYKIPEEVMFRMLEFEASFPYEKQSIKMNVSDIDQLTMEQMIDFCLDKHVEHFLEMPAIKLLIATHRKDERLKVKEELIFKNQIIEEKKK